MQKWFRWAERIEWCRLFLQKECYKKAKIKRGYRFLVAITSLTDGFQPVPTVRTSLLVFISFAAAIRPACDFLSAFSILLSVFAHLFVLRTCDHFIHLRQFLDLSANFSDVSHYFVSDWFLTEKGKSVLNLLSGTLEPNLFRWSVPPLSDLRFRRIGIGMSTGKFSSSLSGFVPLDNFKIPFCCLIVNKFALKI